MHADDSARQLSQKTDNTHRKREKATPILLLKNRLAPELAKRSLALE